MSSETSTIDRNVVYTSLKGAELLACPQINKDTAFTEAERQELGLLGLLPPHIDTIEDQLARAYEAYQHKDSDLERHIYLRALQDRNEVLYYRLLYDHITEMMPIVYTPVVGKACELFSHIYRQHRGLIIPYPHRDRIKEILDNAPCQNVKVIVVTDGERILGLGDQGTGGMGIPIGKLSLYSLCGGIHPATTLPIVLDVGTNNADRLKDPLYIGWQHERISGQDYDGFIESFVEAVIHKFPDALLQWEDFANPNARPILERYRNRLCTFNDDIQGTAAVTVAGLMAAVKAQGKSLGQQQIVMFGAGSAGMGIADLIKAAMMEEGLSEDEARSHFWLLDRPGLLHSGIDEIQDAQRPYVKPWDEIKKNWGLSDSHVTLQDVVAHAGITVLVGTSAQPSVFTEDVVKQMAKNTEHPIIFPLSNPTSRCEASPADLLAWTEGRAMVATGSPFQPVAVKGKVHTIGQCNNSYIFPGMGLGIVSCGSSRVTDSMFMAAARALSECSPALKNEDASLFPPLETIREVSRKIAMAVAQEAGKAGVARVLPKNELERTVNDNFWEPGYKTTRLK
jgi:malate dehydrogenase (oxaloacetate-decarboxylating)